MVQALKSGQMEQSTKETGTIIKQMAEESFGMQTEMYMRENGLMIRQMGMEFTCT